MLAGAAGVLREVAPRIPYEGPTFDCVGTGGDRLGLFNLSTLAGLIVAAAGVPVAKHGNRAITSSCGSADILDKLGIPIALMPEQVAESLEANHFAFLFAPFYHRATRNVQPLRKKLSAQGIPTLFNLLGPLSNPACPSRMLIGVYHPRFAEAMAQAMQRLGCRRAWVVSGYAGEAKWMDEVSLCGPTRIVSFDETEGIETREIHPRDFGLETVPLDALLGGDCARNLALANDILDGKSSPLCDAVCLNAAVGLFLTDAAESVADGIRGAKDLLASGKVRQQVDRLRGILQEAS
jgi:anthranilate phosphoribosyltransferase